MGQTIKEFKHHEIDIRNRDGVVKLIKSVEPVALVHSAAQLSHDLAAAIPFNDFDVNAVGTINLFGAIRHIP